MKSFLHVLYFLVTTCGAFNVGRPDNIISKAASHQLDRSDFLRSFVGGTAGSVAFIATIPSPAVAATQQQPDNKLEASIEALRKEKERVQKEASKELKKVEKQATKEIKTIKKEVKKVEKQATKEVKTIKKEVKKETKKAEKELKQIKKDVTKEAKKAEKVITKEIKKADKVVSKEVETVKVKSERVKQDAAKQLGLEKEKKTSTGIDVSKVKVCDGVKVKCL